MQNRSVTHAALLKSESAHGGDDSLLPTPKKIAPGLPQWPASTPHGGCSDHLKVGILELFLFLEKNKKSKFHILDNLLSSLPRIMSL